MNKLIKYVKEQVIHKLENCQTEDEFEAAIIEAANIFKDNRSSNGDKPLRKSATTFGMSFPEAKRVVAEYIAKQDACGHAVRKVGGVADISMHFDMDTERVRRVIKYLRKDGLLIVVDGCFRITRKER